MAGFSTFLLFFGPQNWDGAFWRSFYPAGPWLIILGSGITFPKDPQKGLFFAQNVPLFATFLTQKRGPLLFHPKYFLMFLAIFYTTGPWLIIFIPENKGDIFPIVIWGTPQKGPKSRVLGHLFGPKNLRQENVPPAGVSGKKGHFWPFLAKI